MWTICGRLSIQVVRIAQNGNMPLLPLCKYNKGAKQGRTQRTGIIIDKISDVNLKSGLIYWKATKKDGWFSSGLLKGDNVDADWPSATLPVPASASFPDCVHLRPICILFTAHFPSSDHGRLAPSPQPCEMGAGRREVLLKSPGACRFAICDAPACSKRPAGNSRPVHRDLSQNRGWLLTASAQGFFFSFVLLH